MKPLLEDRPEAADELQTLYAPIQDELCEVDRLLRSEFCGGDAFVDELAHHGFRLGGKRIRPALVLLSAKASGQARPEHLPLAAAMEAIHTATLLHDDVLDDGLVRRHLQTINARWGNEAAVLLGDYLLAQAVDKLAGLNDPLAFQTIGRAVRIVCEGELRQVHWRGHFDLAEPDYLKLVADKTAELTACCCFVGAQFAGADPATCTRLANFGRQLGIAFQIADDLLDVIGEESVVGKSLGTDLAKQKATLPLIRLLQQLDGDSRARVLDLLTRADNHRSEALRPWFAGSDAVAYCRARAADYAQLAAGELTGLAPSPARDSLEGLARFVVSRRK